MLTTTCGIQYSKLQIEGCIRLGNQDLDFKIRISDFPIKHEIQLKTDFGPPKSFSGGFQLRNLTFGFYGFVILTLFFWGGGGGGNAKKDLRICPREQRSLLRQFCARNPIGNFSKKDVKQLFLSK